MPPTTASNMVSQQSLRLMIIGAQKSGTSSLLSYLGEGSGLSRHIPPEVGVFLSEATDDEVTATLELAYPQGDRGLRIAKYATLMYHPEGLARLMRLHPECHLTVVLRNPLDRAYSSYWFRRGRGLEPELSFEAALAADRDRIGDYRSPNGRVGYIEHGLYASHLAPLYAQQRLPGLHVYTLEDLKTNPTAVCTDLAAKIGSSATFDHLAAAPRNVAGRSRAPALSRWLNGNTSSKAALRAILPSGVASAVARRARRSTKVPFKPPAMSEDTRASLIPLFAADIKHLAELTNKPAVLNWLSVT